MWYINIQIQQKLGKSRKKVDKYNIYVKDDNGVLNEYNLQNVYGKMVYNNDTFSKVMNILTNWIVLVILFICRNSSSRIDI
ncbi:MAG: hypothetical protein L6V81_01355 [Clostridium sp.]|nr:MAG: hypothetical protein L6V81_01355 [Clostridium sp.]